MPPFRTPPTKPMRTERTHEENQERAYIAASRRSDRSLEARVESARRASEIHKKRTGRSLRVREEDVMNEEMYEEEDDDLPMQYRRISALNPNFLNGRLSNYLAGQAGVREYLHNAIYAANQNAMNQNQFFNPMMAGNNMQQGMMQPQMFSNGANGMSQSPYPMQNNTQNNVQGMRPNIVHHRAASIATPQELHAYSQQQRQNVNVKPATPMHLDARRMSVPTNVSPGVPSPVASHPHSNSSSHPPTPHAMGQSPMQVPTPHSASGQEHMPQHRASAGVPPVSGGYDANLEAQIFPLTTKLPLATQQLMGSNATHPSQLSPGLPTPSMGYSYNPNGKPKQSSNADQTSYFGFGGLDQTLSPADMYSSQSFNKTEPQSAVSAPADLSFDAFMNNDIQNFGDLDFDFSSTAFGQSGQITPGSNAVEDWAADMFNYEDAAEQLPTSR